MTERIALHGTVQNDAVFRTTVSGGLSISFGAAPYRSGTGRPSWDDVLRQPVHRDVNVVIHQATGDSSRAQPVPPSPPPMKEPTSEDEGD